MDITTPRQIGKLLRAGRQHAGWTQADLALRLRVSRKWVSEAEAGSAGTTIGPLLRALNAVQVTLTVAQDGKPTQRRPVVFVPDVDAILEATRRRDPIERQQKPRRSQDQ